MNTIWTKTAARSLALFGAVCFATTAVAQDDPPAEGEVQSSKTIEMSVISGDGMGAPMIFATESVDGGGMSTRMGFSLGGEGGMLKLVGGGDGGFNMPAPDPFSMLNNPSVQKDIELVGDQLKKVQELQSNFAKRMQEEIGDLSKGGINPDRFKGIPELMKRLREEQKAEMESLLLPHQLDRLKQVALQTHMKQAGTANALASEAIAEQLGITDEQKDKLKQRAEEVKKKLAEDVAKLKAKAEEDLLSVLDSKQRAKLKELAGDKFEPQDGDWQNSFRRKLKSKRDGSQGRN